MSKNEIAIRIDKECHSVILEDQENGVITRKEIDPDSLADCIERSITLEVKTGLLPPGTLAVNQTDGCTGIAIWHPRRYAEFTYYNTRYERFPLPQLAFSFRLKNGKLSNCRIGVAHDEPPSLQTRMYHYPFSNVTGFSLCTGANALPAYQTLHQTAHFPDYLLALPNNDDHFNTNCNRPRLGYRELLNRLAGEDPAYYYDHILIPSGQTLSDFLRGI